MITVRAALPTDRDARAFADLVGIATSGLFGSVTGPRADIMLQTMFLADRNDYQHRHVRYLEIDGETAGRVCGFSDQDSRVHAGRTAWLHLRCLSWHLPAVIIRGWPLRRLVGFSLQPVDGHFYVPFLAIHAQFRGRGLSRLLLESAEEMAREAGCGTLALSADPTNPVAMNVYRKFGLIDTGRSASGRFRGREEILSRLEKRLG